VRIGVNWGPLAAALNPTLAASEFLVQFRAPVSVTPAANHGLVRIAALSPHNYAIGWLEYGNVPASYRWLAPGTRRRDRE